MFRSSVMIPFVAVHILFVAGIIGIALIVKFIRRKCPNFPTKLIPLISTICSGLLAMGLLLIMRR